MISKTVVVDVHEEKKFRRRALRRMPNEYMELLFGYEKDGKLYVCAFVEIEHEATETTIEYDRDDMDRHKLQASRSGLTFLGSIHTHPHRDFTMYSEADARESWECEERILGICAIDTKQKRRKVYITYWPGVRPLDVEWTHETEVQSYTEYVPTILEPDTSESL